MRDVGDGAQAHVANTSSSESEAEATERVHHRQHHQHPHDQHQHHHHRSHHHRSHHAQPHQRHDDDSDDSGRSASPPSDADVNPAQDQGPMPTPTTSSRTPSQPLSPSALRTPVNRTRHVAACSVVGSPCLQGAVGSSPGAPSPSARLASSGGRPARHPSGGSHTDRPPKTPSMTDRRSHSGVVSMNSSGEVTRHRVSNQVEAEE